MALLKALTNRVHRLQWKLTLSYTAVTVAALLVTLLFVAVLALSLIFLPYDQAPLEIWVQAVNEQAVPLARILLDDTPPNTAWIADFVNYSSVARLESLDLLHLGNLTLYLRATAGLEMLIFDSSGALLGRTGYPAFPDGGQPFETTTIPNLVDPLQAALTGVRDPAQLVNISSPEGEWAVAVPVFASGENDARLMGAVAYVLEAMPTSDKILAHVLTLAGRSMLIFLLGAGAVGTIFGFWTARGMTRRLEHLSAATDAWSCGDFSEFINDTAGDEISLLAKQLNRMAEQLHNLLQRRQEMAVSEERNRLARELHDSAKQQALAASFQLGTVLTLFERDPQAARSHLLEAENLVDAVRKELTDLILELRPPAENGRDFSETLSEYATEWAHQNEIEINITIQGDNELPLETGQTLYRIMQEALANVSRHSAASHTDLSLSYGIDSVALWIEDDGVGFDTMQEYNGIGLASMKERAEAANGSFSIESERGRGTRIQISLPVVDKSPGEILPGLD